MKNKGVRKKTMSMARMAVYISVSSSILISAICIMVASVFFQREAIKIYESMEISLTGAALKNVDQGEIQDLIIKTAEVVNEIPDPKAMREDSEEEYFEKFAAIQNSDEYKKVWNQLNNTRQGTISTAYCLSIIYPERGYWVYVMDASDTNVQRCGELLFDDFSDYIGQPGRRYIGNVTISQKYGRVRTDGVSVYVDEAKNINSYLTADIPISEAVKNVKIFLFQSALAALAITAAASIIVFLAVNHNAVKPIDAIASKAEDFVARYEERFDTHTGTDVFKDVYEGNVQELIKLGISLRSMEFEMNSYLRDIDRLAGEKARIGTELVIATKIQAATIPKNFIDYEKYTQIELFGDYKPAKEVGGDFYDFFTLDDDHLCLVMADVAGKGIPAALYMMVSKIAIQTRAEQGGTPSEILRYVNNRLAANNTVDMFVTVWLGIINVKTGHVIAANAGHEYPVLADENGRYSLFKDKHSAVVGGMVGLKFKDYEFDIPKNGRLFIYTDGVPETMNSKEEFFGTERMVEALNRCTNMGPKETVESIRQALDEFSAGAEQFDDTTLFNIWYKG